MSANTTAWTARITASLALVALAATLLLVGPAHAQQDPPDADSVRSGAVTLDAAAAVDEPQYYHGKSLDRANGDTVDYYTFITTARYELGLGIRGQSIDLLATLEDADGNDVAVSGPPLDPSGDQTIEWLKTTIDAGTYYIRVEAMEDGQTGYYVRFGLKPAPEDSTAPVAPTAPLTAAGHDRVLVAWEIPAQPEGVTVDTMALLRDGAVIATPAWQSGVTSYSYEDTEVAPETAYRYQVRITAGEAVVDGPVATAATPAAPPDDVTSAATLSRTFNLSAAHGPAKYAVVHGETLWFTSSTLGAVVAYDFSGTATGQQFSLDSDNTAHSGSWSDGTTMWVADTTDDKLYAYDLTSSPIGDRVTGKEFALHADNGFAKGIWSDGTTMWVADSTDDKVYAYALSGGARQTSKEFDLDAANTEAFGIWSDGFTIWVADSTDAQAYAYNLKSATVGARLSGKDVTFSGSNPIGIASDTRWAYVVNGITNIAVYPIGNVVTLEGTTSELLSSNDDVHGFAGNHDKYYVVDPNPNRRRVYIYDPDLTTTPTNFSLSANQGDRGAWANDNTLWIAQSGSSPKLFAYKIDSGNVGDRDSAKDIALDSANDAPWGIWSDGAHFWVADVTDNQIRKYDYSGNLLPSAQEINLHSDNDNPIGIWSDGTTMWVADRSDGHVYAYALSGGARQLHEEFGLRSHTHVRGMWADGETMFIANNNDNTPDIVSYRVPARINVIPTVENEIPSYDMTLGSANTFAFPANTFADPNGDTLTYTATLDDDSALPAWLTLTSATRTFSGTPPANSGGHRDIKVTASDGTYSATATFHLTVSSAAPTGWNAGKDFHTALSAAGNNHPHGIWSDGTTMWVADSGDDKLYAYRMSDMARDSGKDFNTLSGAGNSEPRGIWSDGTTMWVADFGGVKVYAYRMSDQARDSGKDFDTLFAAGNRWISGIWSNGPTLWIADNDDDKLYAYRVSDKARDPGKDFDSLSAASNTDPRGIWSDGTTMWVTDQLSNKIYAYRVSDKARDPAKDFDELATAGNGSANSLWSDGSTMWVVDSDDDKLYAYNGVATGAPPTVVRPMSDRAATQWRAFSYRFPSNTFRDPDGDTLTYTARLDDGSALPGWLTFTAAARAFTGTPTDEADMGHFGVKVTAADGNGNSVSDTFRLTVSSATQYGWNAARDIPLHGDNGEPVGIWSNGSTLWVADNTDAKLYAYRMSNKSRYASQDFNTLDAAGNNRPTGIWSNNSTMWVADYDDGKLYAYRLSNKSRDPGKDFTLASANDEPTGIWSDGTTMWVVEDGDSKVYAYKMSDRSRDASREFTLPNDNENAAGIWSYRATLWVSDHIDDKLYAYKVSDKTRIDNLDFDNLAAAGNNDPTGMWSSSSIMLVADTADGKVYAYNMPGPNRAPTVANRIPDQEVDEHQPFTFTIPSGTFRDVNGDTLTYTAARSDNSQLPAWLSFDRGSLTFSGTPGRGDDGNIDVKVTAEDGRGGAVSDTFRIRVNSEFRKLIGNMDLPPKPENVNSYVPEHWYAATFNLRRAVRFTTGSRAVTLDSIAVKFREIPGSPRVPTMKIHAEGDTVQHGYHYPGALVGAMTAPSPLQARVPMYYLPSGTVRLEANTRYYIVLECPGGSCNMYMQSTGYDHHDPGAVGGWRLADDMLTNDRSGGNRYSWVAFGNVIRVIVRGKELPAGTVVGQQPGQSPATALSPIANFAVEAHADRVELSWDIGDLGEASGYRVLRQAPGESELTALADTAGGAYTDRGVAVGQPYLYAVAYVLDGETTLPTNSYGVFVPSPATDPLSSDATLSALSLSGIEFGTFSSGTTSYTASVANGVAQTTVSATVGDDGASYAVKLGGATDADGTVDLAVGANAITVEVTAEDGATTRIYTVTVTRAEAPLSGDATLSGLTLSGVEFGTFSSGTTSYTASVANGVAQTTVSATAGDDGASYAVKLDGATDADGTIALAVGANVITVEVSAEDGVATRTYTVTVTRAEAEAPKTCPPDAELLGRIETADRVVLDMAWLTANEAQVWSGDPAVIPVSAILALFREDGVTNIPLTELESLTLGAMPVGDWEMHDGTEGFAIYNEYLTAVSFTGGCSHDIP